MKGRMKQTYQEHLSEMAQIKVTCLRCGSKNARLSPMGVLCPNCTFNMVDYLRLDKIVKLL